MWESYKRAYENRFTTIDIENSLQEINYPSIEFLSDKRL